MNWRRNGKIPLVYRILLVIHPTCQTEAHHPKRTFLADTSDTSSLPSQNSTRHHTILLCKKERVTWSYKNCNMKMYKTFYINSKLFDSCVHFYFVFTFLNSTLECSGNLYISFARHINFDIIIAVSTYMVILWDKTLDSSVVNSDKTTQRQPRGQQSPPVAYPGILFVGEGVQQIQLRTERTESWGR